MTTFSLQASLPERAAQRAARRAARRYDWPALVPFVAVHLGALGAIWSGVTWQALVCCAVLYVTRMFGVTAGYHRYFSHRTFKTSRVGQFFLALLAETSSQKGALWWAAHHRHHHKHSDEAQDVHSPRQDGFWYSHFGWIYNPESDATNLDRVRDLSKYPELVLLNRFWQVPPLLLGLACYLCLGWSGLCVGFLLSTVLVWHGTFTINSLAHVIGKRRYNTADDSRNSWILALITLGEGWHNNHHHYMHSARQGFFWWEFDPTYYALRVAGWLGLVWEIREPKPANIMPAP